MARIKFGMMMTDARGKLGGHVFSKNRSGAIVRTKVTPANPQTAAQAAARGALGGFSAGWRTLSEETRMQWNEAAAGITLTNVFGDQYSPSGKNYYVGANSNLALAGLGTAGQPLAPSAMQFEGFEEVKLYVDDATFDLVFNAFAADPDAVVVYEATPPMSPGVYNFSGKYYKFLTDPADSVSGNTEIYTAYVNKFGPPAVGQKVGIRMFLIDSGGHASNKATTSVIASLNPTP